MAANRPPHERRPIDAVVPKNNTPSSKSKAASDRGNGGSCRSASGHLASPSGVAHITAELSRIKKTTALLAVGPASGVTGGTVTLTATLTANGSPLDGQSIRFQVRGRDVGKAKTDARGIATLSNARLKGVAAGTYSVVATFGGNASYKVRPGRGTLTVSHFATTLGGVSASGAYGANVGFTATLMSKGAPVPGQPIIFSYNGDAMGTATTNGEGVATLASASLAGVSPGVYPSAVTASFAGGVTYQPNSAGGALTVKQGQAIVSLGGLSQTYNGSPKSVTVTSSPSGLAYTVSYKNASGIPVSNPIAAGLYTVTATVTAPNYAGSTTGTLVIAKAQLHLTGITAENKVYDGTTDATVDTTNAAFVGVVPGDDVSIGNGGTVTFNNKDVGNNKTVTLNGLVLTGADAGNYVLIPPTTTADILPATVTITGITVSNKVYDGTTDATIDTTNAALVGVVPGDDVSVGNGGTVAFDNKDVGNDKTVTFNGLSLTGADAGNYILTLPTTTANITPAPLTVTGITASNKVYDGTTDATIDTTSATLVGVVTGDDVTLDASGATGTFDHQGRRHRPDGDGERPVADGGRRGELRPDRADNDREHHGGDPDRHRHHGQRQGVRRHHRRDARYHRRHAGGRGHRRRRDA